MYGRVKPGHDELNSTQIEIALPHRLKSRRIDIGNDRLLIPVVDRIVAPDPIGVAVDTALAGVDRLLLHRLVAHVLEARIGDREPLHAMHARDADAAETGKGFDRIATHLEPAPE